MLKYFLERETHQRRKLCISEASSGRVLPVLLTPRLPMWPPSPSLEGFGLSTYQNGSEGSLLPRNAPGKVMEKNPLR